MKKSRGACEQLLTVVFGKKFGDVKTMHGMAKLIHKKQSQTLAEKKLRAKRKQYQEKEKGKSVRRVRGLDYENGTRAYITKTLLMQGAIPKYAFRCFTQKKQFYSMLKQMEIEGLIKETTRSGYRFVAFDNFETSKEKAGGEYPQNYVNYFYNYINTDGGELNKFYSGQKSDVLQFYKSTFMRPVMFNAGVMTLLEERESAHKLSQLNLESPSYYSTTEFKRMVMKTERTQDKELSAKQKQAKSVQGSRISGVLFSKGGCYLTYNIQDHFIEWFQGLEKRMATKTEQFIKEKAPDEYKDMKANVLVYASDESMIKKVFDNNRQKIMQKFMYVDYSFESFYMLPLTIEGVWHTHEMTNPDWVIESHKRIGLTFEQVERAETSGVVCDGYDADKKLFILNSCVPNFCKIKQFVNSARLKRNKSAFVVYCYPYQLDLMQQLFGDTAEIKTVEQPIYERIKKNV